MNRKAIIVAILPLLVAMIGVAAILITFQSEKQPPRSPRATHDAADGNAGAQYDSALKLDNGRQIVLTNQQVSERETRQVEVKGGDCT